MQRLYGTIFRLGLAALLLALAGAVSGETWRGLVIAAENRCSPFDRETDYAYPQSIEDQIVQQMGVIYGPYSGSCFSSTADTDIEHIIAVSEAHDSGLCKRDQSVRLSFARDIRNLTIAGPSVNRHEKSDKDAADWLPIHNACWFAGRVVDVRLAYGLTIDLKEAMALEVVLSKCSSIEMAAPICFPRPVARSSAAKSDEIDALALYDQNDNGIISCGEARDQGIAPVKRGHPAYEYMRDSDKDGVVCE